LPERFFNPVLRSVFVAGIC